MMRLPRTRFSVSALLIANVLIPFAISIFAIGFFPYKPYIPGRNVFTSEQGVQPAPIFDKLIFMVVDALRSDFVYSDASSFKFVQSLIRDGAAVPFTAHATSPTITMPRVKALTTGSIPSFLDVILNFAESDTSSTLASQDTWPTQLGSMPDGKVLMYGDDTWLKLFPDVFSRSDGTSSFFVSDFTEVDNNVTRHIPTELKNADWNGMILHYLGLDHIGHKSGPQSPHMRPKQQEMDDIVQKIYSSILSEPHLSSTLLVLCGDHGMNEAGNHGGSAPGETSPALVFISPRLRKISKNNESPVLAAEDEFQYYDVVEQSDVAPTLAGLLGFPVPLNNLGIFIQRLLPLWSSNSDQLKLVRQNAAQVYNIVQATFGVSTEHYSDSSRDCSSEKGDGAYLHCLWATSSTAMESSIAAERKLESALKFLDNAQRIMSSTASNYNLQKLCLGTGLAVFAMLVSGSSAAQLLAPNSGELLVFFAICILYGSMMFASSFVEEEHHFWYWTMSAWFVLLLAKIARSRGLKSATQGILLLALMSAFRVMRRWNQTGQKHAGSPDIGRTHLPNYPVQLWILVFLTLGGVGYSLNKSLASPHSKASLAIPFVGVWASALGFKISFTAADAPELVTSILQPVSLILTKFSLTTQARAVFVGLGWFACAIIIQDRLTIRASRNLNRTMMALHALLTILLITQSRVNNIPLFFIFQAQFEILRALPVSTYEISVTAILMQHASYFAFGGTNAISSIDLSSAYNGVNSYNVLAVGFLTFVSNWVGPIWWSLSSLLLLTERDPHGFALVRHLILQTFFVSASLASVMAACTMLRTHLFIWTVFSPKYLYSIAWSLGQHMLVDCILGGVLWTCT